MFIQRVLLTQEITISITQTIILQSYRIWQDCSAVSQCHRGL